MLIDETYEDNKLNLQISGDIDLQMMITFREKIIMIERLSPLDVTIDLGRVNNIDSTAIGLLLRLYKHQKNEGKFLKIKNPSRRIEELLRFSSLSQSIV